MTTIDGSQVARIIGLLAGLLIAAVLVGAVVMANLGIGFEGAGGVVRLLPPPVAVGP